MNEEEQMTEEEILEAAERIKRERSNPDDRGPQIWVMVAEGIEFDQIIALPDGQVLTIRAKAWVPVEIGALCENPDKVVRRSAYKNALLMSKIREVPIEEVHEIWAKPGARQNFIDCYYRKEQAAVADDEEEMPDLLHRQIRVLQDESLMPMNNMYGLFDGDEDHAIKVFNEMAAGGHLKSSVLMVAGEGAEERGWKRFAHIVSVQVRERMEKSMAADGKESDEVDRNEATVVHTEPSIAESQGRRVKPQKVLDRNNRPTDTRQEPRVLGEQKGEFDLKEIYKDGADNVDIPVHDGTKSNPQDNGPGIHDGPPPVVST